VLNIDEAQVLIEERDSSLGTGGMRSKLKAASLCQEAGIETWIVGGSQNDFLLGAIDGKNKYTVFSTLAG
jgi:glutamate 5-kinase